QYTLQYDDAHIEIESIEPGKLDLGPDNYYRYSPGNMTATWSKGEGVSASSSEVLFTIVAKAKNGGALRDMLSLNHRVIHSEAYVGTGDISNIALRVAPLDSTFVMYHNKPNPYEGQTVIRFRLPKSDRATITPYDVTGRM